MTRLLDRLLRPLELRVAEQKVGEAPSSDGIRAYWIRIRPESDTWVIGFIERITRLHIHLAVLWGITKPGPFGSRILTHARLVLSGL